jgi:uncharacterized protein (TIGR03118 family)
MLQRAQLAGMVAAMVLASPGMFGAAANVYIQRNLVADIAGQAEVTDPNLVNPWGVAFSGTGAFWVSNQGKGNSTLYNGSGTITPLVVPVPAASSTAQGTPTGQVFNGTATAFLLPGINRAASFIFDTEDGTISGWANGINATNTAAIMVNNSASGAVYTGLAIGSNAAGALLLYAANFNSGKIDVFDNKYNATTVTGGFTDANVPAGFAPYNIWPVGGKLYVLYAQQDSKKQVSVAGAGAGYVDVFDFDGNLQKRLISGGALNAPWGVALAPATFGAFAGNLLVGNFGDGKINAFDVNTGALTGTLQDSKGNPIVNQGLWALIFGNGGSGGDKNILYITAGPSFGDTKVHGLLAAIAPPAAVLSVMNAASYATGAIAPGEVVTLTGITIGPSPLAQAAIPATGAINSSLNGVTVTFNGLPAPILYCEASQTSVLVPYGMQGAANATIAVAYHGQTASTTVPIANTAPGIFTTNFSGSGQAVALNADGSVNSATNAATTGTVITFFGTGEGWTNPTGEDGVVNDRIIREPVASVSVTIGGKPAQVIYAGTAFGLVQGVLQVEALIPAGVTGTAPVVLTAGSAASQTTATISVK